MSFSETPFWIWWREYGKHFEALAIIVLLIILWFVYADNSTKLEETQESCPCAFQYCVNDPTEFNVPIQLNLSGIIEEDDLVK